ncbi:putative anucleate primary sterigmata protein b [Rosellinia necatrix]|uniref:Putative anucleate primary sterigmata protein b n=1 Tax=Rosellinia necatrix TaxID=77044 RepID=A0A1W2TQK8_ROSNE|nr:putative anucleate primary sterigmata protein b [Rosellinia necatrix]
MEEDENRGASQHGNGVKAKRPAHHANDISFIDTTKLEPDYEQHFDSMTDEERVRAHLQDVESSFVAPASPTFEAAGGHAGVDDTYLFYVAPKQPSNPTPTASTTAPAAPAQQQGVADSRIADSRVAPVSAPEEPEANQLATREPLVATSASRATTPASALFDLAQAHPEDLSLPESRPTSPPDNDEDNDRTSATDTADVTNATNVTNATSALGDLSSPTVAAAARAATRPTPAAAAANTTAHEFPIDYDDCDAPMEDTYNIENLEGAGDDESSQTGTHTPNHSGSDVPTNPPSVDAGVTPGNALKVAKRPKYLRSRNASQRSSDSSFLTNDDVESDATVGLGVDYALQSGGAAPAFGLRRSASNDLSRSLSMGSMASGFDDSFDPLRAGPLEPLEEVESPLHEHPGDTLTTPRSNKGPLNPPTDTIIARHVRSVEVPESLAKEYQTKGGLSTPPQPYHKASDYTPAPNTAARSGRSMTLKEQSNTIERLSKENFDLKLKVMFLSDRLDKLSEEGIKEMISENVELRTSLAVIQRDNKVLRRRVKELEKRRYDDEGRPSTARSGLSSDGRATPTFGSSTQANDEEIILLREQIEEYVREIERLRSDNMGSELEKRKLVDTIKTMGDRATERVGETLERQEEADVWKDLLEQETARREQADDENRRLRDEVFSLKQEMSGSAPVGGGLHHTTNIYNITRKPRQTSPARSRPVSGLSGEAEHMNSLSQSSTLVEELRRESEKLRHENAELRREVGAQTSMLTSRHREKERLYQEIEDLKLAQRRAGPAPSTLDSLLDRSASRIGANDRPISRGSGRSRLTMTAEDPDREQLENRITEQRDKINELKFKNQELQRELETCMGDFEDAMEGRRQAEDNAAAAQEEIENTTNDLIAIQAERDEALQEQAAWEEKFVNLQEEAQGLVNELEAEADQKTEEIQRLQLDLDERIDNFEALQEEMRSMTESLIRLEDEQAKTHKIMEQLEQELADSGKELEDLEAQLLESNEKTQRLSVQQESSQGEIAFLREEQEGDKIRIGDLEAALANSEQLVTDERDRAKELDQRLINERNQRELIANREKEEVQQIVNDLNREASTAKEEARILRKSLGNREVEATQWKERLMELENNLREALGDLNGTRSSLLQSIATLQRELETTVRELDTTKSALLEKERIIKQRDGLLESHALESRKLGDLLDKERQAHRNVKNQFETFQRTHHHVSRTVTSQDSRIMELETGRASDKRKMAQLETTFKEQIAERNSLLLVLWTRLAALCGSDWTHGNSLINGRALPSPESISTMLPGFSKNLFAAIKMIESLLGNFQSRIKSVERELWKEYQTLENNLEVRTKKLERLETLARSGIASGNFDAQTRFSQLETAYRALKIEHATLQRAHDARSRSVGYTERTLRKTPSGHASGEEQTEGGSPSPLVPTGPHARESKLPRSKITHLETTTTKTTASSITRTSSNIGTADVGRLNSSHGDASSTRGVDQAQWLLRLRELEYKLKEEREARQMDRAAARQRIQDSERQNNELAAELVRTKRRAGE